ncbi:DUF7662 domain-containing protein [Candidatus Palauibacter sp.]|uniref:DUF7662 domain-containing protein n=1 Tax=Candidatus Palauibacter sp. TaxID=3101350 RepID=UPI003B59F3E0
MTEPRTLLLREAAARGKYAPLYNHLCVRGGREWNTTFSELEKLLGFGLPSSSRIHRPWWANPGRSGGHSHALAWGAAGWKTRGVNLEAETLTFVRSVGPSDRVGAGALPDPEPGRPKSLDDIFTPHDFGPWPEGFRCGRDEIYGDEGR